MAGEETFPFEVRQLPLSALKPAPYNPRKPLTPNDKAYKKLKAGIEQFGLVEPLVWNESTGHLVGGHARLRILGELGWQTVPVAVVRLELAQEKALNVLLNNQEAQGRYDTAKLAELLEELADLPELEMTGYDKRFLESLRFEPCQEPMTADGQSTAEAATIEVTLQIPVADYERVEAELDRLIRDYRLVAHVR